MKHPIGIKRKILCVFVVVLALTAALHALLASFLLNRQNRLSAFALLHRDLTAWDSGLTRLTLRLREAATATVSDHVFLTQLAELVTLEADLESPASLGEPVEAARTAAYLKSVSLNRLELALRTGGFSDIAVYVAGKLSHCLSTTEAGMSIRREGSGGLWIAAGAAADGKLPLASWPAWTEGRPDPLLPPATPGEPRTAVSLGFPKPDLTVLRIVVPVHGVVQDILTDSDALPSSRLLSELSIGAPASPPEGIGAGRRAARFAVVLFQKRLDRSALAEVAGTTDNLPALLSPDGRHRQLLSSLDFVSDEMLRTASQAPSAAADPGAAAFVTAGGGRFYALARGWQFEGQTRLVLALAASAKPARDQVFQTVVAIVAVAAAVLVLSVGAGGFWLGRFIDPILSLTAAVKRIAHQSRLDSAARPTGLTTVPELRSLALKAHDEVGDLADAFAELVGELRQSLGTLEARVHERTGALEERTRQLEAMNQELGAFSYSVSHDLRAPLRAIDGFCQALLEDYGAGLGDQARGYLARVRGAAQRMSQLIDDLLSLARVTRAELRLERVDLTALAGDIVAELGRREPQRQVRCRIAPGMAVEGDARFLRVALENLLGNAWKFTARRSEAEVEFGMNQEQDGPVYYVRDNGAGFDMRYVDRLFGAFQRLHTTDEFPGSGIGLATVQRVVQRHGGRVWAEGWVDRGATFRFSLPRAKR